MYFPQHLYYFQYISDLRNTPYRKRHTSRTEPAYGKLKIIVEAYIHPYQVLVSFLCYQYITPKHALIVVFASRKATPEFWSFCSP